MSTLSIALDGYLSSPLSIATGGLLSVTVETDDSNLYSSPRRRRLGAITDADTRLLSRTVSAYSIESTSSVSLIDVNVGIESPSVSSITQVMFVGVHQWSPETMSENSVVIGGSKQSIKTPGIKTITKKKVDSQARLNVKTIKKRKYNE